MRLRRRLRSGKLVHGSTLPNDRGSAHTPRRRGSGRVVGPLGRFDDLIDTSVSRLRGRRTLDRTFYVLSETANHSLLWHGINLVDATIGGPLHRRRALRRSVILGVEQALVNGVIKNIFRRDRPLPPEHAPHRLRTPRTTSFPSGHASAGACAATLLSQDLGAAPVWWTTAGIVSASRVYVGVHHASDVLGGLLLGRLLARAADKIWPAVEELMQDTATERVHDPVDHPTRGSRTARFDGVPAIGDPPSSASR